MKNAASTAEVAVWRFCQPAGHVQMGFLSELPTLDPTTLSRELLGEGPLSFSWLDYEEFNRELVQQNATRAQDAGDEPSKHGAISALLMENYREGDERCGILGLKEDGGTVALCAFGVCANRMRPKPRTHYGRIDVVLSKRRCRGRRLGSLVVLAATRLMLARASTELYSISCMCAHANMAAILLSIGGFDLVENERTAVIDATIALDDTSIAELTERVDSQLSSCAQRARYAARQARLLASGRP